MKFSVATQAFYANEIQYGESLPADVIDLDSEKYATLYTSINNGSYVYLYKGELIPSEIKPDQYHSWDSSEKKWVMSEEAMIQKKNDEVNIATEKKRQLISEINSQTQLLQTQLILGLISENDKALLIDWMNYLKDIQAVDVSTAPDIIWPASPKM